MTAKPINNSLQQEFHKVSSNSINKSSKKFQQLKNSKKTHKSSEIQDILKRIESSSLDNNDDEELQNFSQLPLSNATLVALETKKFSKMSKIQQSTILASLKGHDILASSPTGSGKTLAFIIPALEILWQKQWSASDGIGVLILSPTRELAIQIFDYFSQLLDYDYNYNKNNNNKYNSSYNNNSQLSDKYHHRFNVSLIIGGHNNMLNEVKMIRKAMILIATPGRLLQHMDESEAFNLLNLQLLIIDEADRILDMKFRRDVDAILDNLPKNRQTLMFSATQTKNVKDLARVNLKNPLVINTSNNIDFKNINNNNDNNNNNNNIYDVKNDFIPSIPSQLQHVYTIAYQHEKPSLLYSFLTSHIGEKILVFLSSCKQVKFYYELLKALKLNSSFEILAIHGKMKQTQRLHAFQRFSSFTTANNNDNKYNNSNNNNRKARNYTRNSTILLATDLASRGLDFQDLKWVIQLDCAEDVDTYVHRCGRTGRFESRGASLSVFLEHEKSIMLEQCHKKAIIIKEIKLNQEKQKDITDQISKACQRNAELMESAKRALMGYMKFQLRRKNAKLFDYNSIDMQLFAQSYGLPNAPKIRAISKKEKRDREIEKQKNNIINDDITENSDHDNSNNNISKNTCNDNDNNNDDDDNGDNTDISDNSNDNCGNDIIDIN